MDERHWWFASKLQETFHFGGYDNPTLLEDFLSEPDVVELINKFLSPGEPHKLFFYCDATPPSSHCSPVPPSLGGEAQTYSASSSRRLNLVSGLTRDVLAQGCVCLYVLRRNMETEVDAAMMERELYCGELKNSVLSSLATLLAEAYNPMLHSQRNWRECSDETVSNFLQNFSKFSAALGDSAMKAQMYQPVLQRPGSDLRSYLSHGEQQHRGGGGGRRWEEAMEECEVLVGDWIGTLESILIDATDERLEDAHGSLQSELNKWKRRHTQICAIVEQLKSKECKTVVAALVASKSRLLKKWRAIDLQITDAFNNVRDRVRYLESLSPHLEPLEALSPPSPSQVISITLPALLATMKQMEGVSKVYACSGYLGVLCIKLSNTLVRLCVSDLETYSSKVEGQFWTLASEAINFKAQPPQAKSTTKGMKMGSSFISKLELYLQLSASYKEFLSQVRDTFQVQHVNFSSVGKKNSLTSAKKPSISSKSSASDERCAPHSNHPLGLSLQNSEKIMAGMNDFTSRVSKILDLVCTLGQFTRLNLEQKIKGLPRFSNLWSLECLERSESEREEEADSLSQSFNQSERVSVRTATVRDDGSVSDITLATPDYLDMLISRNIQQQQHQLQLLQPAESERGRALHSGALSTLKEESWAESQAENEEEHKETEHKPQVLIAGEGVASVASTVTSAPPSQSQSLHSNSYHSSNSSADSVGVMVHISIKMIRAHLELNCGVGVVEMFGMGGAKSGAIFMQAYQEYADQVQQLERNICIYLKTLFVKPMPSSQALDMLSRFKPVAPRPTIKEALEKCMLIAFNRYAMELEQIQVLYEKYKGSPVVSRNVPPVSEAVQWARHLLSRVEQPMQHFRANEAVMKSVYSLHIGKLHNRLATTLLKYETLWLDRWRTAVESGRGSLKAPLLVQEAQTEEKTIKVNFSQE